MAMGDQNQAARKGLRSVNVAAGFFTCLQLLLATYATFLLYFISPAALDLSHVAKQWLIHPYLSNNSSNNSTINNNIYMNSTNIVSSNNGSICIPGEPIDMKKNLKVSNDSRVLQIKQHLYQQILSFQQTNTKGGCETLTQLMQLPSSSSSSSPKIIVILNHYKRTTLCMQLDSLLQQTLPFYSLWILAFNTENQHLIRNSLQQSPYKEKNNIHLITSTYDFKYYGRFQLALQAEDADYVYIVDDDMIPGKRILEIFAHVAGTSKYHNSLLGSIGRILPFRQSDFSFPSYRKPLSTSAGLYLPDPAYEITVSHILQVDFLSSSWFLSSSLVKSLFTESPFTYTTGEDLHLSYQLQKYRGVNTYVLPVDPDDRETWADLDHTLAYASESTANHKEIVELRDRQWWAAFGRGFVTQWSVMFPQHSDVLFYAHSLADVIDMAPLVQRFRTTRGKKAYVVVTGGPYCPCEDASLILGWPTNSCIDRRFKIFDLNILHTPSSSSSSSNENLSLFQEVYAAMKGLIKIHSPGLVISVADLVPDVRDAIALAVYRSNTTTLLQLPRTSIQRTLWISTVTSSALRRTYEFISRFLTDRTPVTEWNRMKITVNIITHNRPHSLQRLLKSLANAYYVGDEIPMTFNVDAAADTETLKVINDYDWSHGQTNIRHRIVPGGLIRAVGESWYPASDDEFGLLLEDDIEVSPYFYMWLKYALLVYHYDPQTNIPELNGISLYTPRVIEVVRERPKWNSTDFFKHIHPNIPYLHQLPCSWGELYFPKHWREFYRYINRRYTVNPKENTVQIQRSTSNGWRSSWKKYMIDLMYLRGYVTLYPNFPNQMSFSTNHMEPGAHINASDNVIQHKRDEFEVPLMEDDFWKLLPQQRLPSFTKLPVVNLFNQISSIKGLKATGAKLKQDVLPCSGNLTLAVVVVDDTTGEPISCTPV